MPSFFGLRFTAHDEDERAQKNTFTRWINLHLEEHSSSGRVTDLFEDIKDGVLLCHLIEVLTGEALQVCRTRASKRVHHIANLTTALTVLRRRGLELVNNNASDIADGNPRIVLGLIWQIILHFQIESSMSLLREWGWGSVSIQQEYSRETTPVRATSPIKSRLASLLSSSPSTSADSPKISIKHAKGSVEQVMLRWINAEIAEKLTLRVENMDRDWKDGVLFNALVHRWRPDVVDMEKVRSAEPRENLENAFELAHKHLGIYKLLLVDDVLCQKPDKRSIITYVSQFARISGRSAPVEESNPTHTEFLDWLAATCRLDLKNNEQGMYFRVRREFIEYRSLYNTIIATKFNYTIDELAQIQERWESIRSNLEATAISAEKRLPKPYSTLSMWTATGQSIINTPLNLPTDDPHKCVAILQKMISEHNRHFIDMGAKMEELNKAAESGGLGGRPVAAEYVEPLRIRMATLADEEPLKLATLKILHAHYTLFAYLFDMESKMKLWSSAESLQLLERWIAEYTQLEETNPRSKCNHYIDDLRKTLVTGPETKLDGESMLRTCRSRSEETLRSFELMRTKLWTLQTLWSEWQLELERLDRIAMSGINSRSNTLQDESEAIRVLGSKFDELAPLLSASARLASNQRMELLRLKVKQLNKFGASRRLVVELVPPTSQNVIRVTNVNEAEKSIQEIEGNLSKRSSRGGERELEETYEKMEQKRRLAALRKAKPMMNAVEIYLAQLHEWLDSPDAYDRAKALDVLDQVGKTIDAIDAEAATSHVDCEGYRRALQMCTSKLHGEGTSANQPVEEPPVDKEYVREVMSRAELILSRRETNEDEVRSSMNDMADCEIVLNDWKSRRLAVVRERWEAKKAEFELWRLHMDRVQQIATELDQQRGVEPATLAELLRIEQSCSSDLMRSTDLGHSLLLAIQKLKFMVETGFEERLESLKMSGEEDCSVAHNIVQEVGEELVAFCPQLNERHTEARQVLTKKMELFRRLQNYYDAVKYLRNQNIARNRITLIEVPAISSELQSLLERCDSEWQKDALQLRAELNAISGSFFELEFDRVNEKLNLLTYEKDKLRDLMRARVEYLDAVRDFIASADSSIDIAQMATPSDSPQPLQEKAKELCKDLETKAENLKHLQAPAEMIISDLIPQQLIRKFRWQLIGPSDEDTKSFDEAARYLEELINRNLPSSQDPQQFLSVTLELKRMEEEESKAFDEMTELAILDEHKPTRDRIAALFKNRQEQRKRLTLNFLYSYHDYLNTLFRSYEEKVVFLINNRALTEVQEFNDGEWKRWKEAVGELESALDAPMRVRLRPEFADLQRKAFSLDGKIGRSMMSSAKQRRHEERLQAKLTQLESWLDAMENDTDVVERMLPGEEQTTRLTQLLISCLGQQRLVGKLERLNVQNRDHVQQLCQKYYIILNRLRSHNLDESALPIHVGTLVQGAPTRSQLSISSLASSDFADRPESVQSVGSSIDIATASADSELPMEKAIGDIRRKLHILIQSYNDAPKNLATCIADYNLLLTYRGELNNLYADLPPGNDTKKEALENSLHHLMEHLNETAGKLQEEIDEEVSLSAKEKEIVHELHTLEQRVKGRDVTDVDVVHDLEQLQAQMDLLRMISRKPRQFVESDLMERGGGSSSRSRSKRKVLVMVTNTVTTIIQVVEERLLTIEARSRDPVVQQKLDLVKTNLKKLEEETEITSPESAIDIATAEKSLQPHLETGILATAMARGVPGRDTFEATVLGVEQALYIADNIDLESCDDPHVLSESLHILEDQSISMDALCNTASELAKDGEPYYLDKVSALQERLLAVKQSLADRLAKLSDETPADIIIVPREEQPTTSTAEFDEMADEILSATISAEKVLDDETADSERLLKAKELLECQVPVLSRISDLASLRSQSGDPEGIDTVSSITEQFNSVRYALDDRINEFSAQGHEDMVFIPEADSIPTTSSADFNKLVDDLREEIGSAEKALDDTSEDVQRLQDVKERLQSHEPVLSTLRNMASIRAQQGDSEGIDVISSLSEEFEGVRYAIEDRIEELADKGESGAEFEDYGSDAEQRTSADDFLQLASEVRAAITSVEKVLDDETADSQRTHEAREKILNQEDVLSRLSEIAVTKAHSGETDAIDDLSLLQQEYNAVRYAIEDKLEEFASKQRRSDVDEEIARRAADETLKHTITPVSTRLVQLVNDADRLIGDAEGAPTQYRPSAEELSNECKKAVEILRDAPKTHPSVESLETALTAAENMIPVLEERANYWDEFVKVRDEADVELDKLRQPLEEVIAKPRRTVNDAKHDFDVISLERQKSDILGGKVRRLQELSELLDPLESAYADVRFIDVDAEQTEKQYDDVLNELSTEIEDENLLCDSVDHFVTELNSICESLAKLPTKETIENIEQFQIPALQAQLSMLQQRHEEANHARKHVDPDSSRLSMLNDRMKSLTECLHDTKSSVEKEEQDRLIVLIRIRISELLSRPRYQLSVEQLDDVEKQIETLPKEDAEELRKQIEDLRKQKDQHDNDRREVVERLAKVDELITTLPTTRDIPTVEANLARMRDARDSLATLPSELLADENLANQVESRRKAIDDLSRQDEENLQKMLADRDMRNNAIESLEQLQRDIEELESVLPIALPSSSELNDFKQSKTPKLFTKLDAIVDIPVDLLQKKEDLSNRIDIINKKLDEQVNDMKNFEQKTDELQKVVDDCRDKVKTRDAPASIDEVANDEKDLSSILVIIESIPQEDLSTRNQLARDVNNVKEQVKSQLATLRKALSDEEKAREKENDLKNRLSAIDHSLNTIDPRNEDAAKQQVTSLEIELQQLAGVAESCHQFATSPSSVVSHDDLDKTLPEKLQKLQKVCDEKKRDVEQVAQLNAVAPEILLISESLQQQPEDIPQNLNEQQSVLEELETKKQRLENLIQTIPEGDASEELRQKSVWDLSKLKDLLKRLGDSVGDKLAALAAFNAARKDAEDQLLLITGPDAGDRTSDELKKDEESLHRLQQSISQLENGNLDDEQRNEHAQLLDRINKALIIIKQRRSDVDEEIARRAADETLRNAIAPISTRLIQLVSDADRLLEDVQGEPAMYRPLAKEIGEECKKALNILQDAPETHPAVEALERALKAGESTIATLEVRANNWDEFVRDGEAATRLMESINSFISRSLPRAVLLSSSQGEALLSTMKKMYSDIEYLRAAEKHLNDLALLLRPLIQVEQEIRFFTVDQETTEKLFEETTERLAAELTAEAQLTRTLEILTTELNQCSEELTTDGARKDRLSHESLLQDIIAHLENQKIVVERSAQTRQYIESSTSASLDLLMQRAQELLETLRLAPQVSHEPAPMEEYDVDAAADVLAALYPEEHPYRVLAEHGFEDIGSDTETRSELESIDGSSSGMLSPIPDTSTGHVVPPTQFHRQRSRWRRVLRTALPLQAMLVLLLGAACLVPHCDDEYCCQLLNNFARSFDPSLEFINGPPPF